MVTVPTVTGRSVQMAGAPNQYLDSSAATPEAFGAGVGRALAGVGQSVSGVGDVLMEKAKEEKGRADANAVLDANNKVQDAVREQLYGKDGQGGEMAKQGADAFGATARLRQNFEKISGELAAGLPDDKARDAFRRTLSATRDATLDATARREAQIGVEQRAKTQQNTLDLAGQNVVSFANDDKLVQKHIDLGIAAIRANTTGLPADVVETNVQKFRSGAQLDRLKRIAIDSPTAAEALYGKIKGDLFGEDHVKAETILRPLRDRTEGLNVAREIIGSPGPTATRLGEVTGAPGGLPRMVAGANLPAVVTASGMGESGLNPNTPDSPKGAAGIMQVMPGTAREISAKLGDGKITKDMSDEQVRQVIRDPALSLRYGAIYHQQNLQRFGGDVEAALVAYNAGPGNAEKWLRAGRDYGVLPDRGQTEPYVRKALSRYADLMGGSYDVGGGAPNIYNKVAMGDIPANAKYSRDNWPLKFYKPDDMLAPTAGGAQVDARAAAMADRLGQTFFDKTGIRVGINDTGPSTGSTSGRRRGASDPADNPHVPNSQHIHGRAFDFQVQKLTPDQKALFLSTAREVGFTGVGFYEGGSGHLHLDTGKPRSWGGLPAWAQRAMAVQAIGSQSMAVGPAPGGMAVPPSWQVSAGGGLGVPQRVTMGAAAGTGTSFLPPSLTPQAVDLIGSPTAVGGGGGGSGGISAAAAAAGVSTAPSGGGMGPAPVAATVINPVPTRISVPDDFDAQGWRDAVLNDPRLDTPAKRSAASAMVEREIRAREFARKSALKNVRASAIQHVLQGGSSDDLDPQTQAALYDLDPKFLTDTLPAMEERRAKRLDKTNEKVYNALTLMDKDQLAQMDLSPFVNDLSKADMRHFTERQRSALDSSAEAAKKWTGIQSQQQMMNVALQGAGIVPDKDDAKVQARVGLFQMRMQAEVDAYKARNGDKEPTPKEFQEMAAHLLTPINGGDWTGKNQYLFEQGTAEENTRRRTLMDAAPIGYDGRFVAARSLDQIPQATLQTMADNHTRIMGRAVKPAEAVQLYNDGLMAETGRLVDPPNDERRQIIDALRRKYGPGIQTDPKRAEEFERRIKDMYAAKLKALFDPPPEKAVRLQ